MMFKRLLIFSVWLFFSRSLYAQSALQISSIAFYNFENLFDTLDDPRNWGDDEFLPSGTYNYTGEVYRDKLHNLARVISQLGMPMTPQGPAIIGTAEIENDRVLEDLIRQPEIKDRYQFIHFDSRDTRGVDVAMLYNPGYFKLISSRAINIDLGQGGEIKGGRTRDILLVSGVLSDDTVHILINHWPSRRGGEAASASLRATAANVNKRVADSLFSVDAQSKIILMGDLNDDPNSASVTKVLCAKGNMEKVPVNGMYNPFVLHYRKGYGSLVFDDRWNLFDQIIISGAFLKRNSSTGSQWIFHGSEVFKRDFMLEKFGQYKGYPKRSFYNNRWNDGYSDHLPTIVYLTKTSK